VSTPPHLDPAVRHDVVIMFDATDCNPNGDPDQNNQPRTDDESGHGLVTDVAIKRKVRDTVALLHGDDRRYGIFVEAGHALNTRWADARENTPGAADPLATLCGMYWDVRMFGQVLTGGKGGQSSSVRGPVQLTFGRSIDPVLPTDHTITRVTQTRQEDIDKGESTEIGSKWTVPYGLYRTHLYYSPGRAAKTGITSDDLDTLWRAIAAMFEHDRSSNRGGMDIAGLWVFSHPDALGVAPSRAVLRRIQVTAADPGRAPRGYADYRRQIDRAGMPAGIELATIVDIWED
jgi:CRISPR-associated protein Csd2